MKKLFTILALISSLFAVLLSILPAFKLAIFPVIAALIFGLIAFYFSKNTRPLKKIIQLSLLLIILATSIVIYKAIFEKNEVVKTEVTKEKEIKSKEDAIKDLEELDDLGDIE